MTIVVLSATVSILPCTGRCIHTSGSRFCRRRSHICSESHTAAWDRVDIASDTLPSFWIGSRCLDSRRNWRTHTHSSSCCRTNSGLPPHKGRPREAGCRGLLREREKEAIVQHQERNIIVISECSEYALVRSHRQPGAVSFPLVSIIRR